MKKTIKDFDYDKTEETSFTDTFLEAEQNLFYRYQDYDKEPIIDLARQLHEENLHNQHWDCFVLYPNIIDENNQNRFILFRVHQENEEEIMRQSVAEHSVCMLCMIKQYVAMYYGSIENKDFMVLVFFDFEKDTDETIYIPIENWILKIDEIESIKDISDNGHPNYTRNFIQEAGGFIEAVVETYGSMIKKDPNFEELLLQRLVKVKFISEKLEA